MQADVQIVDHRATYTGGFITQHYAISGRVVNSGSGVSEPVTIGITINDPDGNILYTGTASPQPSILQPEQEAPFTHDVTNNDLGGYNGEWKYELNIINQ